MGRAPGWRAGAPGSRPAQLHPVRAGVMLAFLARQEVVFALRQPGLFADPMPATVAGEGLVREGGAPGHQFLVDPHQVLLHVRSSSRISSWSAPPASLRWYQGGGSPVSPRSTLRTLSRSILSGPGDGADAVALLFEFQDGRSPLRFKHGTPPARSARTGPARRIALGAGPAPVPGPPSAAEPSSTPSWTRRMALRRARRPISPRSSNSSASPAFPAGSGSRRRPRPAEQRGIGQDPRANLGAAPGSAGMKPEQLIAAFQNWPVMRTRSGSLTSRPDLS